MEMHSTRQGYTNTQVYRGLDLTIKNSYSTKIPSVCRTSIAKLRKIQAIQSDSSSSILAKPPSTQGRKWAQTIAL